MTGARYLFILLLALLPARAAAADRWISITSSHFDMYTSAGDKRGREVIGFFEQLREFFAKARGLTPQASKKVYIVLFRNESEYRPYRANATGAAYYASGPDADYIVLHSMAGESSRIAVHEFTHLMVKHAGVQIPLWLNEGLAELYSTLHTVARKVQIGDVILSHAQVLTENRLIDLPTLFEVDRDSPYYNNEKFVHLFYAQSWALTHMIELDQAYRAQSSAFMEELARGASAEQAFRKAYNKSLDDVQKDLVGYVHRTSFTAVLFGMPLGRSAELPSVREVSPVESGVLLAKLLEGARKTDEARAHLEALAQANPRQWRIEAALGSLAFHERNFPEACRRFKSADELGAQDARMFFDYAMSLQSSAAPDSQVADALRRAVRYQPDYDDAHYYLGLTLVNQGQYSDAVAELGAIQRLDPERAFSYFRALAYAAERAGDHERAKVALDMAREKAIRPEETADLDRLAQYMTQATARAAPPPAPYSPTPIPQPPQPEEPRLVRRTEVTPEPAPQPLLPPPSPRAAGRLERVDCLQNRAVLHINTGGVRHAFLIARPDQVRIRNSASGHVDFTCGVQAPKAVIIEYQPRPDAALKTEGEVLAIEFQ